MEHLIESVKKYPCLWATDLEEHKISIVRDAAWTKVIEECDIPDIREAKNLWKKLRDGHRQSINRKRTTSGQTSESGKNWKYDKMMEFLLPYIGSRERVTNVLPTSEQSNSQEFQTILPNEESPTNNLDSEVTTRKRKRPNGIKRYLEAENKKLENRMVKRDLLRRKLLTSQEEKDSMKCFFDAMYEMSKNLPEEFQMKIQREVFNSVMQAREDNMLSRNEFSHSTTTTHCTKIEPSYSTNEEEGTYEELY